MTSLRSRTPLICCPIQRPWPRSRSLDAKRLTLEVNVMPRNDVSLAFHQRMGFTSLDERDTDYGTRVVMMEKML